MIDDSVLRLQETLLTVHHLAEDSVNGRAR